MDYSSLADEPVGKSFDNLIENDNKGNFLNDFGPRCFNLCVQKIQEPSLDEFEIGCLKDCYVKSFYAAGTSNI